MPPRAAVLGPVEQSPDPVRVGQNSLASPVERDGWAQKNLPPVAHTRSLGTQAGSPGEVSGLLGEPSKNFGKTKNQNSAEPARLSGEAKRVSDAIQAWAPSSVWQWERLTISVTLLRDSRNQQKVGLWIESSGKFVTAYIRRDMSSLKTAYSWLAGCGASRADKIRGEQ
jgi:hypothetical protein